MGDTFFPFFPNIKKKRFRWLFDGLEEKGVEKGVV
jgi:hypothetical protein